MTATLPKLSYTLAEAAATTGLTEKQLRAHIGLGRLKAKRAAESKQAKGEGAGKYVITHAALVRFLEELPDA